MNTRDRRVIRTRMDLKVAFLSLLKQSKSFKKLSVTKIVEKANYNRATFYAHFSDKDALINEVIQDVIDGFIDAFRSPYKHQSVLDVQNLSNQTIKIFNYVEENQDLFTLLFDTTIFPQFQKQFCKTIENVFLKELSYIDNDFYSIDKKLYTCSQAYSIIGMLNYWIETDFDESAEYMNQQLLLMSKFKPSIVRFSFEEGNIGVKR